MKVAFERAVWAGSLSGVEPWAWPQRRSLAAGIRRSLHSPPARPGADGSQWQRGGLFLSFLFSKCFQPNLAVVLGGRVKFKSGCFSVHCRGWKECLRRALHFPAWPTVRRAPVHPVERCRRSPGVVPAVGSGAGRLCLVSLKMLLSWICEDRLRARRKDGRAPIQTTRTLQRLQVPNVVKQMLNKGDCFFFNEYRLCVAVCAGGLFPTLPSSAKAT